ncbi:MAG: 1-deoxy-D-xylulose-5-phosphate synthase, partial [Spirochaetales bacterium]|nr:1-deoxy-D-xylulose-5-phosphate synthase [Spirochaetales bacterium]
MLSDIQSIEDLKKIPVNQLPKLADEVRGKIIETVKENGGHLASNLGVVELTIALHYVFSSPTDKIIFDVGHQSYTHKILTGRYDKMDTLRQKDGLSGFSRRSESVHDPVDSGHASSSISQAAGFAQSNLLRGEDGRVIAVIGDGAMTGGVAMEGLNYCGQNRLPVIVVLNDNEMSIDCSVSPVSRYINHVAASERYRKFIDEMRHPLGRKFPLNRLFKKLFNKFEKGIRVLLDYDNIFTQMGFDYVGPIDGHNIEELIYILRNVQKQLTKPVLLYVKTKKGRGYKPAEDDPVSYHGVAPKFYLPKEKKRSYTEVFSAKLCELAEKHQDIVAITAAMESGTGLSKFHKSFPDRFFDVGITEQHAVTFASTMAYNGLRPVVAIYSTFFMRAVDQLCQDVAISNAPVILAIDRAGIVGMDGETHNGQFDLSIFRMFPQMTVLVPADGRELELMLEWAY